MRYLYLSCFLFIILSIFPEKSNAEEMVKIRLVNYIGETDHIDLQLEGAYSTLDPTLLLKEGVNYTLSVKKGTMYLSGEGMKQRIDGSLVLIPETYDIDHSVTMNKRSYLGAMEIELEENKYIRPINQLPLEDYLKGVVPFEVYPTWGLETLKAQALAARTYAFSHLNEEMDDTIKYQVYGGFTWNENTTKAVEQTTNEVITFQHQLIDALYSASNGGITENNAHVWGGEAMSYFPVKRDPYDPTEPWQYTIHKTQIDLDEIDWNNPNWWEESKEKDEKIIHAMKNWMQENGYPGDVKIIAIPRFELSKQQLDSKRTEKGSITVEFLHRLIDGTILFEQLDLNDVKLNKIRPMIGGNLFKSYLIDSLEYDRDMYTMKGKGFGHGVGMSQWGASIMGDSGKTYEEILQFYYPGTAITHFSKRIIDKTLD
ncbi:SpoIID/LytB domain-containing protein [Metabacillus rhizolycopersici]|uniref:SpoIID/LytB domain-containing protein n=1 Tax=Metabacillus rhizolycopersici TaxID=2875709 RepID=A0ABS7UMD3_9BACI|nr:SpoIID/LytB domain-containing protein [Metabacillus rhizolycopersici]MBZ5749475.1 SpoIID/LytB domain-containing protein [Metabacillus rhizolycopersici]